MNNEEIQDQGSARMVHPMAGQRHLQQQQQQRQQRQQGMLMLLPTRSAMQMLQAQLLLALQLCLGQCFMCSLQRRQACQMLTSRTSTKLCMTCPRSAQSPHTHQLGTNADTFTSHAQNSSHFKNAKRLDAQSSQYNQCFA